VKPDLPRRRLRRREQAPDILNQRRNAGIVPVDPSLELVKPARQVLVRGQQLAKFDEDPRDQECSLGWRLGFQGA